MCVREKATAAAKKNIERETEEEESSTIRQRTYFECCRTYKAHTKTNSDYLLFFFSFNFNQFNKTRHKKKS